MHQDEPFAHRDELMTAALEEFSRRGFESASLNAILARAGMSKGQFYHHFDSKQALYLWLVDLLIARKQAHFATVEPPPGGDVFDTLRYLVSIGTAFSRADPEMEAFVRSFLRERGNPIYQTAMAAHPFADNEALAALIDAGYERGDFSADLSLEFIRKVILYHFDHLIELLDLWDPEDLDRALDEFVAFLRRGLGQSHR